ncbi:EXS (ERD1/XPR1/SYG1) family protein [Striga asiatica]|uniref:EXS (ERD1/XPR1/SYG1) family protein n=1 Tax=Striga asiatica TaxID=4170 RepID=A0A5A7P9H8_STRAF|nr:EXS (ERD1/XPR1/SYG1) family protein [Striga asiatica]
MDSKTIKIIDGVVTMGNVSKLTTPTQTICKINQTRYFVLLYEVAFEFLATFGFFLQLAWMFWVSPSVSLDVYIYILECKIKNSLYTSGQIIRKGIWHLSIFYNEH